MPDLPELPLQPEDELEKRRLKRLLLEERLRYYDRVIGWTGSKLIGGALTVIGGVETLDPNLFSVVLSNPAATLGVGLAMLLGRRIVDTLSKFGGLG